MRKLVFFSNVTLGYGSPKYIYFLESMHLQKIYISIQSIEPFEIIRPYYEIHSGFDRKIIGKYLLLFLIDKCGFIKSYKLTKFVIKPIRAVLTGLQITKFAILSYLTPVFLVTTYESFLFGLFSRETVILQNYSEIWDEIDNKKNRYLLSNILHKRYCRTVDYIIAPQEDRIRLASQRYPNAEPFLVQNCPRLTDFRSPTLDLTKLRILYQGRIGVHSFGEKILQLARYLPNTIEFHFAGIVEENLKAEFIELVEDGKIQNHGYLNWSDLANLRNKCNIGLVSWSNNTLNTKYCAPNKLYEYIASGMLVICFNNYSLEKLNEKYNFAKIEVEPSALIDYLLTIDQDTMKNMSNNNYTLFKTELNYEYQNRAVFRKIIESTKSI
jgi:hypothetical protein